VNIFAKIESLAKQQVQIALDQGWWRDYEGPATEQLVEKLCAVFEQAFAHLCCSGTMAVELALRGVGVRPGDNVLLAGYDFAGNFRAIESLGARPVLIDNSADAWVIDHQWLPNDDSEKYAAIIVSPLHGSLVDLTPIKNWCHARGCALILDECQVPAAMIGGRLLGSQADATCLSFGGSKLLTSGRGGAVLTPHEQVLQRIRIASDRGNDATALSQLQAASLLPQVDHLVAANHYRASLFEPIWKIAAEFNWLLDPFAMANPGQLDGSVPVSDGENLRVFYKIGWRLKGQVNRNGIMHKAAEHGIPLGEGFRGFHLRSVRRCGRVGELPNAKAAAEQTILLSHTYLTGNVDLDEVKLQKWHSFLNDCIDARKID